MKYQQQLDETDCVVGSYFILKNKMSFGELISFNALLVYFLGPLQRLLNLQPNMQEAYVAAQRLALARALLGNPELLIFDEATSHLDNISEYNIHETLKSLKNEKITTILIAHRLSTIIHCDEIFVFDNGKIIESGNHVQLLAKNGLYSKFWNSAQ